jgi:uncharacterized BrkB/YihY/UPF0761 family membrane protein
VDTVDELEHHALVQAPVEPVDEDGVAAALVGTGVSVLATVLLWWQYALLAARGQGWWLWVGLTATGAGVLFIAYTLYRRRWRLSPLRQPSVEQ